VTGDKANSGRIQAENLKQLEGLNLRIQRLCPLLGWIAVRRTNLGIHPYGVGMRGCNSGSHRILERGDEKTRRGGGEVGVVERGESGDGRGIEIGPEESKKA